MINKTIVCTVFLFLYCFSPLLYSKESTWDEIQQKEQKVFALMREMREKNETPQEIHQKIENYLHAKESLSVSSKEKMMGLLASWDQKNTKLLGALDDYIKGQMDFFIEYTQTELEKSLVYLKGYLTAEDYSDLTRSVEKFAAQKKEYQQNRDYYGTPKAYKILYPYFDYFQKLQKIADAHNSLLSKEKTPGVLSEIGNLLSASGSGLRLLPSIMDTFIALSRSQKPEQGKTPTVAKLDKVVDSYGRTLGVETQMEGVDKLHEFIAKNHDDKTVNFVMPPHRVSLYDMFPMAKLGMDHAVFTSAYSYLPQSLAQKVDLTSDVIVVGNNSGNIDGVNHLKAIDKFYKVLKTVNPPFFLNLPEGYTSVWNEVKPIRDSMSRKLFKSLIEKGYKINIIPMNLEIAPMFLTDNHGDIDSKKIKASIGTPLTADMIQLLVDSAGKAIASDDPDAELKKYDIVTRFLRSLYQFSFKEYLPLTNNEIRDRIDRHGVLRPIPKVQDSDSKCVWMR